ncbi:hypothetical protein GWI33_014486 [Rhynchophorus ferrugineus]|uniref:Uncharacterized protein n=1 Tax=Rhynchophorus ferrugineus TaxID=354439 RepID=A0A834M6V1_RHYFE|nr:hypothetical protein GWI33_014486 [Rhynchophorus ferrugineus]
MNPHGSEIRRKALGERVVDRPTDNRLPPPGPRDRSLTLSAAAAIVSPAAIRHRPQAGVVGNICHRWGRKSSHSATAVCVSY